MRKQNNKGDGWHLQYQGQPWNPITGCDDISEGCRWCYARDTAIWLKRQGNKRYTTDGIFGKFTDHPGKVAPGFALTLHPDILEKLPPTGGKDRRVFVCSMSDLFHKDVPADFIKGVFECMEHPRRTDTNFLVLTKRATRMAKTVNQIYGNREMPPNIWLGVTVENQKAASRVDYLRKTPAQIKWLCCEPLIGPLQVDLTGIDWVVGAGESRHGGPPRPMKADWVRTLRDQCTKLGIPFMFKQWGAPTNNPDPKNDPSFDEDPHGGCYLDGVEWEQYP